MKKISVVAEVEVEMFVEDDVDVDKAVEHLGRMDLGDVTGAMLTGTERICYPHDLFPKKFYGSGVVKATVTPNSDDQEEYDSIPSPERMSTFEDLFPHRKTGPAPEGKDNEFLEDFSKWPKEEQLRFVRFVELERAGIFERVQQPDGTALIVDGPNHNGEDLNVELLKPPEWPEDAQLGLLRFVDLMRFREFLRD